MILPFTKTKKKGLQGGAHRYDDHRNIYIKKHKLLLFKIPKVASTSLWQIAANLLGHAINRKDQLRQINLPFLTAHEIDEHSEVFKAGFVRNPWDRLLSCYLQKKKFKRQDFFKRNDLSLDMSFAEFATAVCAIPDSEADRHFKSQYTFVIDHSGANIANFIGRFEHLNEDFDQLCQQAKLPQMKLPTWNKTQHAPYTTYYTPHLAEIVAKRYKIDLALFGYEFGQPLDASARFNWQKPIDSELKLEIVQYKSSKLLNVLHHLEEKAN